MIKVNEDEAKYFDDCSNCGEVIDCGKMYDIEVGLDKLRLCYSCVNSLNKKINRSLDDD